MLLGTTLVMGKVVSDWRCGDAPGMSPDGASRCEDALRITPHIGSGRTDSGNSFQARESDPPSFGSFASAALPRPRSRPSRQHPPTSGLDRTVRPGARVLKADEGRCDAGPPAFVLDPLGPAQELRPAWQNSSAMEPLALARP